MIQTLFNIDLGIPIARSDYPKTIGTIHPESVKGKLFFNKYIPWQGVEWIPEGRSRTPGHPEPAASAPWRPTSPRTG